MQSSRETKLLNCLSVGLVLLAGDLFDGAPSRETVEALKRGRRCGCATG